MPRIIQTFTDFGNREWRNKLDGGKADDKTPDDFPPEDIEIGSRVEREHTSNPDLAAEIAIDHLSEDPEYYDKLISSGIADEKGARELFDELKGKNARDKARKDIMDYIEQDNEEYEEDEDIDEYEYDDELELDDDDYEEDVLGADKTDYDEDDELIFDEEEPKNKRNIMEKSIKNYKSFLNEANESAPEPVPEPAPEVDPNIQRKYEKENKYKWQIPYGKKVVDQLNEHGFGFFVPDEDATDAVTKPTKDTHFIIINILNLTYSIVDHEYPDIRMIDTSRLKHIFENL